MFFYEIEIFIELKIRIVYAEGFFSQSVITETFLYSNTKSKIVSLSNTIFETVFTQITTLKIDTWNPKPHTNRSNKTAASETQEKRDFSILQRDKA